VKQDVWRTELRNDPTLRRYIRLLPRTRPIDESAQAALAARIRRGDRSAIDRLVQAHLPLVVEIARDLFLRRRKKRLGGRDLVAEGNIALVALAGRVSIWQHHPFAEVATGCIKRRMLNALAEEAEDLMGAGDGPGLPYIEYQTTMGFIPDRELVAREKAEASELAQRQR